MPSTPVHQRYHHAFLSHASADKSAIVEPLYRWLKETAGIPVWYDRDRLEGGDDWMRSLQTGLNDSRACVVVYTPKSAESPWVRQEVQYAFRQTQSVPGFRLIGVSVDGSKTADDFLTSIQYIAMPGGRLTIDFCDHLLRALHRRDVNLEPELSPERAKDLYISRTWRASEAPLADYVCRALAAARFRLIGDADDQGEWDEHRIRSIIISCRALVAVLPDRGEGETSDFMIREIEIARKQSVPYVIIAEPTVKLTGDLIDSALDVLRLSPNQLDPAVPLLQGVVETLQERSRPPVKPHYVFLATDLNPHHRQRNRIIKNLIQRITAMECVMGEELRGSNTHEQIAERIRKSYLTIADITDEVVKPDGSKDYPWTNLNICIEVGIAWGAGSNIELLGHAPRQTPVYMLMNREVADYEDDVDLLGKINKITYPYRRRVLNYELAAPK